MGFVGKWGQVRFDGLQVLLGSKKVQVGTCEICRGFCMVMMEMNKVDFYKWMKYRK